MTETQSVIFEYCNELEEEAAKITTRAVYKKQNTEKPKHIATIMNIVHTLERKGYLETDGIGKWNVVQYKTTESGAYAYADLNKNKGGLAVITAKAITSGKANGLLEILNTVNANSHSSNKTISILLGKKTPQATTQQVNELRKCGFLIRQKTGLIYTYSIDEKVLAKYKVNLD